MVEDVFSGGRIEQLASLDADWANPDDYALIAEGLRGTALNIAKQLLRPIEQDARAKLLYSAHRVYARLLVADMAFIRREEALEEEARVNDAVCRISLEKMADALEEAHGMLVKSKGDVDEKDVAVLWLEFATKFARVVKLHGGLTNYTTGPFAGLAKLAGLLESTTILPEDVAELVDLIGKARDIPVGQCVGSLDKNCRMFNMSFEVAAGLLKFREGMAGGGTR